ncbi:transcriptional regulator, GntR family [Arboricoccus pini]|uniref:Transcriptional regulator, GntR family n=1 Tax=Arboricoccus pini TaxID=1963835 RepID=A0A212RTA5_9PROT|nr:GntR family transcriptional regulator [Arboricoccus pini]SNB75742.1 transcriptional regulator, GntR family [Arboricoccus pini]
MNSPAPFKRIATCRSPFGDPGLAEERQFLAHEEAGDVTLTDRAYRILEELITTLELPPGTTLTEQALGRRLEIGRTPIREAVQRLVRDGLLLVIPRRGILVSDIKIETQLQLLETRRVVEGLIARLAASRANAEERRAFTEIATRMREAAAANDDRGFMRLDRRFNQLLADTARNEFAVRSMGLLTPLCRRFWFKYYKNAGDLPLAAHLHADMAEAIAQNDPKRAMAATGRLLDYIEAFTRHTLDP